MTRARRRAVVAASAGVVLLLLLALRLSAPGRVRAALAERGRANGLEISCDEVSLSSFAWRAEITGLTVKAMGDVVFTAPRVVADTTLGTVLGGDAVLDALEVEDGVLDLVVDAEGRTNLFRALHHDGGTPPPLPPLLVRDLRFARCRARVRDPARVQGVAVDVHGVDARGSGLQFGTSPDPSIVGTFTMDARLAQRGGSAPLSVVAWSRPTKATGPDEPTFVGHVALTDADLASFPAYVNDTYRHVIGADRIDLVLSMDVVEGVIGKGAVVGTVPGREQPLTARFSGAWMDPTVDPAGALTTLFELPFARFGHAGSTVWRAGSSLVGGAVGIVENLGSGDVAGAGKAAVTGIGGALTNAGEGLLSVLKGAGSALGIGGKDEIPAPRDPVKVHAAVRERLLDLRRADLDR